MPPTSSILFPEVLADSSTILRAEVGGYERTPRANSTAVIEFDNGAEQKRRRSRTLYSFRLRTVPVPVVVTRSINDFLETVGDGSVNFHFYDPEALYYGDLLLGITDGTDTLKLAFRAVSSWTSLLVDGSPVDFGMNTEFYATKEDQLGWISTPDAGQEVRAANVYARKRYICRMTAWRAYAYQGGAIEADLFDPASPTVPLFKRVYDFSFSEIGG